MVRGGMERELSTQTQYLRALHDSTLLDELLGSHFLPEQPE